MQASTEFNLKQIYHTDFALRAHGILSLDDMKDVTNSFSSPCPRSKIEKKSSSAF